MSELRTEFERLHPVPECVESFGGIYCAKSNNMDEELEADRYHEKWVGFQSGHAAGLGRAADAVDAPESQVKHIAGLDRAIALLTQSRDRCLAENTRLAKRVAELDPSSCHPMRLNAADLADGG